MMKIAITGSIASGKTTASKIISRGKGPLFSADLVVKNLYKKKIFKIKVSRILNIKINHNFKKEIKKKIIKNKKFIKKIERIAHPMVRQGMFAFIKKNKKKKILFFEIPLLIESKLTNYFDIIIFIKSKKTLRLKRYLSNKGNRNLFHILNNHQMKDTEKAKRCDYVVVNNKSLLVLKNKLSNIIKNYE